MGAENVHVYAKLTARKVYKYIFQPSAEKHDDVLSQIVIGDETYVHDNAIDSKQNSTQLIVRVWVSSNTRRKQRSFETPKEYYWSIINIKVFLQLENTTLQY